jgi:hypothetical protein
MADETAWEAYLSFTSLAPSLQVSLGAPELLPHYDTGEPSLSFIASLRFGAADCEGAHGASAARLVAGLYEWAAAVRGREPMVDLILTLPRAFPASPPEVRVLRPLLEAGTGGVQDGFPLGVPELFHQAWAPNTPLSEALPLAVGAVRRCLLRHGAVVAAGGAAARANYALPAYRATRRRALFPPDAWMRSVCHRSGFQKDYRVFSSVFAQLFMSVDVPPGFDAGGKALLPMSALELVMRSELREGLEAGSAAGWLRGASAAAAAAAGGGNGGGGGARGLAGLLSVDAADSTTGESAMIFAMFGALETPVFMGVREFTSPDPGVVIVPPEMLANLGVPEGSAVRLYRVELPQITSMVLQPHAAAFLDVARSAGLPPREFLEESFSNFSALQPGVTILCDGALAGGNSVVDVGEEPAGGGAPALAIRAPEGAFRFSVISIKPAGARAGALFAGFSSSISIEFLPAADTLDDGVLSAGAESDGGGSAVWGGGGGGGGGSSSPPPPLPLLLPPTAAAAAESPLPGIGVAALAPDPAAAALLAGARAVGGSEVPPRAVVEDSCGAAPPAPPAGVPATAVQVRLANGQKLVVKLALSATVGDLQRAAAGAHATGGRPFALRGGFPPRPLEDSNATIEQAGLANASVMQQVM